MINTEFKIQWSKSCYPLLGNGKNLLKWLKTTSKNDSTICSRQENASSTSSMEFQTTWTGWKRLGPVPWVKGRWTGRAITGGVAMTREPRPPHQKPSWKSWVISWVHESNYHGILMDSVNSWVKVDEESNYHELSIRLKHTANGLGCKSL